MELVLELAGKGLSLIFSVALVGLLLTTGAGGDCTSNTSPDFEPGASMLASGFLSGSKAIDLEPGATDRLCCTCERTT